jgi:hypothetical protein
VQPKAYAFRSVWRVRASTDDAFQVLAELGDYPAWWPEVRQASRLGDAAFRLTVRSLLPYDLEFTSATTRQDRTRGVLEAALDGDLSGFSRWTVLPEGPGARLVFEERVVANKALLRRLNLVARPAFRANHTLMMRHGEAGLRVYLAGYRSGRDSGAQG